MKFNELDPGSEEARSHGCICTGLIPGAKCPVWEINWDCIIHNDWLLNCIGNRQVTKEME